MTIPLRTLGWAIFGGVLIAGLVLGLAVPWLPRMRQLEGVLVTLLCVAVTVILVARRTRPRV